MSKKRLAGIIIGCVVVVTAVLVISLSGRDPVISFQDPNLETAIRETLNRPSGPIHTSMLAGLASLSAFNSGIKDLAGLQYCTNLTDLNLEVNQISDISPLANLTNLTLLDLQWNQINDISPLVENAGLSEGDLVYLHGNPLSSDSMTMYIPQLQARGVGVTY